MDVGGYDPEFKSADTPLWLRMLGRGRGWEISDPLYLYRWNPNSLLHTQTRPSDQGYRMLVNYTPELLPLHPETSPRPKTGAYYQEKSWRWIAQLGLLAGDRQAVEQAVAVLKRYGPLTNETRLVRAFTYLGRAGHVFYKWRKRHQFRHRPDWEKLFTGLVGPLALDPGDYLPDG